MVKIRRIAANGQRIHTLWTEWLPFTVTFNIRNFINKLLNMRTLIASFLMVLAFSNMGYSQESEKLFAMIYSKGPTWNENISTAEQAYFKAHSQHLQKLRKEGKILVGGRYSDLGFMILKVEDASMAERITKQDSSVVAGTFKVELFEFHPFYSGCVGKTKQE
nr:YciI family protein [Allomuricauda sp.]